MRRVEKSLSMGFARTAEGREAGRLLLEDEARFIDLANSPLWLNREQVIYAGP